MSGLVQNLRLSAALSLVVTVVGASAAAAQTTASTRAASSGASQPALGSPAFEELIRGKKVVVTASDGSIREGVFTVSPTGLSGAEPGSLILVPYGQIVRVERISTRVRKWTFIGLGVGTLVGLRIGTNYHAAFFALPGAGIGAGVGSAIGGVLNVTRRQKDLVYDVRRRTTTMSLAPILSPTRKGMALRMTWR